MAVHIESLSDNTHQAITTSHVHQGPSHLHLHPTSNPPPHQHLPQRPLQSPTRRHPHHHSRQRHPPHPPLLLPNISLTPHAQARDIYDCRNKRGLLGLLIRTESSSGPTTQDDPVNHVYNSFGIFLYVLSSVLDRRSIDNNGLRLIGCLHYDKTLDNAFWNGQEIIFGDGDGVYFTGFPKSLDVVVHELMHGVTDHTAGSFGGGDKGSWRRIGWLGGGLVFGRRERNVLVAGVGEMGLRSLKAPGTAYDDAVLGRDGQPSHMNVFVYTEKDNGGVHWNSGIPSHAFYLCAVGFGGRSWERAAVVWYQALTDPRVEPNCSFEMFACVTVDIAEAMFGGEAG
ncbi:zincin [Aspergillus eucalypticola CBS 122712]|uniref:Zincin n=1 Tax=Aspergillus eucalypticola (strain CBS 122712 / IBT 29274) TaxID=1448314 RepID=A0A317VP34_ASPEC|nr:zincin [Aspergillus eucalypticola CBS 122712]PWY75675.1 zincin [Aspergillus eucalypticola CBS 122712]